MTGKLCSDIVEGNVREKERNSLKFDTFQIFFIKYENGNILVIKSKVKIKVV